MLTINMDMPKNCCYCPCMHYRKRGIFGKYLMKCHAREDANEDWFLIADNLTFSDLADLSKKVKRPTWCPLFDVSKSYSNLIYRDQAVKTILGEPTEAHYPSWYAEIINNCPSAFDSQTETG